MAHAHASSKSDLTTSRLFDVSHVVALVTGGATGIGEMAASGFIQGGARVIIASRKESELKSELLFPSGAVDVACVRYFGTEDSRPGLDTGDSIQSLCSHRNNDRP